MLVFWDGAPPPLTGRQAQLSNVPQPYPSSVTLSRTNS